MNNTPFLQVRHAAKAFGAVQALTDCSITLYGGQIHALVGGNGAGKSTLVELIAGNERPDRGEFFVEGERVRITSPRAASSHGIGVVYQNLALVNALDVSANVFLGREEVYGGFFKWLGVLNNRRMRQETIEELDRLHVTIPDVDARVVNMSGGQRQCIACARALMNGAKILLMDEPTAALGVREAAQVMDLMRRCRDEGSAVMLISHNMEDVFRLSDKITVLRLGKSIATVNTKDVTPDYIVGLITGAIAPKEEHRQSNELP